MIIAADPHSGVPVYRQIVDQVRFFITSGRLRPGDELPSTRTLSTQLGVNPMTVSKAYSILEREGALERRPGLALVVRARRNRQVEHDREAHLRQALSAAVRVAHQLDVDEDDALEVFREMLEHHRPKARRSE